MTNEEDISDYELVTDTLYKKCVKALEDVLRTEVKGIADGNALLRKDVDRLETEAKAEAIRAQRREKQLQDQITALKSGGSSRGIV